MVTVKNMKSLTCSLVLGAVVLILSSMLVQAVPNYLAMSIIFSGSSNQNLNGLYTPGAVLDSHGYPVYYHFPWVAGDSFIQYELDEGDGWVLENGVGLDVFSLGYGALPASASNGTVSIISFENNASVNVGFPDTSTIEPVNTINGGMFFDESDFGVSGAGFNLEWTRSYNSAMTTTNGLGFRWSHNYDWSLTPTTNTYINGSYTNAFPALYLNMGGGEARMLLKNDANKCWETVQTPPLSIPFTTNNEYFLALPAGYSCLFGTNGFIKVMSNSWNNTLAFNYTNAGGSVSLQKVTHSDGRALVFSYNSNRLVRVDTPSTNLCYLYYYNAGGEVTGVVTRSSSGDFSTSYTYDTNGVHAMLQHQNPLGEVATYAYQTNASGQLTPICIKVDVATNYYEHTISYGSGKTTVTYTRGNTNAVYNYYFDPASKLLSRLDQPGAPTEVEMFNYDSLLQTKTNIQHGHLISQTNDVWSGKSYSLSVTSPINGNAGGVYNYLSTYNGKGCYTNSFYWGPFRMEWTGSQWRIWCPGTSESYYKINGSTYPDGGGWQRSDGINVTINVTCLNNAITTSNVFASDISASFKYDSQGRMTQYYPIYNSSSSPLWSFSWNTNYNTLTSTTDPEGHKAEWEYTNGSVCVERIYPATNQPVETHYAYASNGLLASITNANGHWVAFQSDCYGYPTQTVSQGGATNGMTRDVLGHLKEIRLLSNVTDTNDPPNMIPRVIAFDPNELGWVRGITYPDSSFETFAFDAMGNVTNHVDVAGRTKIFSWLPTKKLASTTRYLTASGSNQAVTIGLAYDQQMNVLNIKDELGRAVESYQLDLHDRPMSVTNVESQVMKISWGLQDKVNQIVRFDGATNAFAYDKNSRVSQVSYPDGNISLAYYKNGLPMTASNCWGTISNAFDGANRLTAQIQPVPNGNVAYGYYPAGQVSNTVSVAGTNAYVFDADERIAALTTVAPNSRQDSIGYVYDPINGQLSQVTYSNGLTCAYGYDIMDRLTKLTWRNVSNQVLKSRVYTYTSAGMISNIAYETGEKATYSYDSLDRLTREKHTDYYGQVISDEKYDFDLAGNRTKKTVLNANGDNLMTVNYSLSTGNRLGSWTVAETNLVAQFSVLGYASDPIGTNDRFGYLWVSNSANAVVKPYVSGTNFFAYDLTVGMGTQYVFAAIRDEAGNTTYVTNRFYPTTLTNGTYQYNAAGCLTNFQYTGKDYQQSLGLTWNGQYQLTAVSTNGAVAEQYGYDATGRRIFIVQGGTTNWMVYDGNQVVAEVDGSGNLKKSYVYGPGIDNPISMTVYGTTTNTYYYLKDHLNSVLALTDGNGVIVESYRFDAWGRVLGVYNANGEQVDESAVGNRILWQGREYSWKTGLYYFRARWYEPVTGRWLSNDPIGISGGLNQYVFCANNPVNLRDPFGLCEDGEKYVREYTLELAKDPNNIKHIEDTIAKFDIKIQDKIEGKDRKWKFREHVYRSDEMGNIGPAYATTIIYGPNTSAVMMMAAEVRYHDWSTGPIQTVQDAKGSFYDNGIGIGAALHDIWAKR